MSELLAQDESAKQLSIIQDIGVRMKALSSAANTNLVGAGAELLAKDMVVSYFAGQHFLAEGVPGVAKTHTATNLGKAVCNSLDESNVVYVKPFGRAQGAQDRQPADILGAMVYNQKTGEFEARPGPIVAHITLFDEINRYRSNVQSAINEVGSEGQISLGGETIHLPKGHFIVATQNPNAYGEGTNSQSSAVGDRFGMSTVTPKPTREERVQAMNRTADNVSSKPVPTNVLDVQDMPTYQQAIRENVKFSSGVIEVAGAVIDFVMEQAGNNGKDPENEKAPGFRSGDALVSLAKARVAMRGEQLVEYKDITGENGLLFSILRHRVEIYDDPVGTLNEWIDHAAKGSQHHTVSKKAKKSRRAA